MIYGSRLSPFISLENDGRPKPQNTSGANCHGCQVLVNRWDPLELRLLFGTSSGRIGGEEPTRHPKTGLFWSPGSGYLSWIFTSKNVRIYFSAIDAIFFGLDWSFDRILCGKFSYKQAAKESEFTWFHRNRVAPSFPILMVGLLK